MKTYDIDCFELTQPDGGGMYEEHIAYVVTENVAKEWKGKSTGWPRNYRKYKKTIIVFESLTEMEEHSKSEFRKATLAKLNAAEKEALGLGD